MTRRNGLPDLLGRTSEVHGEEVLYRFANGLAIKTEVWNKGDTLRILPLGSPQGSLMNHIVHFPEVVRGKRIFEPFAGSGAISFMALKLGAEHVDFLDVNPRAAAFLAENARLNQLDASRFRFIEGDVATFEPDGRYDLMIANPPFVPCPDGIEGSITSNGGAEGNRFVEIVLRRLEDFLAPDGEALMLVFQLVRHGRPLLVELILDTLVKRPVELTPSQQRPISFGAISEAYTQLFADAREEIARWRSALLEKHGPGLALCHYVARVGGRGERATCCVMRDDFAEQFGESFWVPSEDEKGTALGRAFENWVPPAGAP
jgi:release factor glutamine methyltransferase